MIKPEVLIEYPEFVLKGKRNFLFLTNKKEYLNLKNCYFRNPYHSPNLLFLKNKPKILNDILVYPLWQKNLEKNLVFLSFLIKKRGKIVKGKIDINEVKPKVKHLLYFDFFSPTSADLTLKSLYYMSNIKKDKFIFWYAALASIIQTSFAYLITKGIFETSPEKILDKIQDFSFRKINFELIKRRLKDQRVENVEKLYYTACKFIDQMCEKVLEENNLI